MQKQGWVRMTHKESGTGESKLVTPESFEEVWAPRGWTLVEEEAAPKAVTTPVIPKPEEPKANG